MPDLRDTIAAATEAGKDYVTIQEVKSDGSRAVRILRISTSEIGNIHDDAPSTQDLTL